MKFVCKGLALSGQGRVDALVEPLGVQIWQRILATITAELVDGSEVVAVDSAVLVAILLVLGHVALDR